MAMLLSEGPAKLMVKVMAAAMANSFAASMAIVVIFGLMVSTFLTLVVVPSLYSLFDTWKRSASGWGAFIRRLYWAPFERATGEKVFKE